MSNPVNHDLGASLFPTGSQAAGTFYSTAPGATQAGQSTSSGVWNNLTNTACRGLSLFVSVTAATGTLTVYVEGYDVASGLWYTILASAALGVTTQRLLVYPGATVTTNVSADDVLPATFRIRMVVAGGNVTATVGGCLLV